MKNRTTILVNKSRAKNPNAGELVVETLGKDANSFAYKRNGLVAKLQVRYPKLLGWLPIARNPKLILFRGEAILVRLSDGKSYAIDNESITLLDNEAHWRNQ